MFDEQHAVFSVFVLLLLCELSDSLCDGGGDVVPVFCLDCCVVDAVDVAGVVFATCAEHPTHRSV